MLMKIEQKQMHKKIFCIKKDILLNTLVFFVDQLKVDCVNGFNIIGVHPTDLLEKAGLNSICTNCFKNIRQILPSILRHNFKAIIFINASKQYLMMP